MLSVFASPAAGLSVLFIYLFTYLFIDIHFRVKIRYLNYLLTPQVVSHFKSIFFFSLTKIWKTRIFQPFFTVAGGCQSRDCLAQNSVLNNGVAIFGSPLSYTERRSVRSVISLS